MKPLAGGALTNAKLSLRYILEHPVSVAIPGMDSLEQVEENAAVGNERKPLTDQEQGGTGSISGEIGNQFLQAL